MAARPADTDNIIAEFGLRHQFLLHVPPGDVRGESGQRERGYAFLLAQRGVQRPGRPAGCTITIVLRPQRVLYYRLKCRNERDVVMGAGPMRVGGCAVAQIAAG
jgi:hypothetical protein